MPARRRTFLFGACACLATGCAGPTTRLPLAAEGELRRAQAEVAAGGPPVRRSLPDSQVLETLRRVRARLEPAAAALCREMGVGVCTWRFQAVNDPSLNASAGPGGVITMNRGIVEYARNDDEVAFVMAHEMGHQAANHLANMQRNVTIGAVAGALVLGALGAYAGGGALAQSGVETGAQLGGAIGRLSFSKEQEREADHLGALALYRAGFDLGRARGFLLTMARASGRTETGMLDTHPAGPDRLAAFDAGVAEIRASRGALPGRG
jgi:predicted Zn-dependent protease